ncbi:hypothetical protein V8B97DRAFT_1914832 [Scleroderma yunnanense]
MPSKVSDWVAGAVKARTANTIFSIFNGKALNIDKIFLWKDEKYRQPKKQECDLYTMDIDKNKFKSQRTPTSMNGKCYNYEEDHFKCDCPDLNRGTSKPMPQKSNTHKAQVKELKAELEKLEKKIDADSYETTGNDATGGHCSNPQPDFCQMY